MDGWKITYLLGKPSFRGYVSFREGTKKQVFFLFDLISYLYIIDHFQPLGMPHGKELLLMIFANDY